MCKLCQKFEGELKMYTKTAVCIGINNYPDPANNLLGCVPDSKLIRDILLKKFNFDKVFLLNDKMATYENVVKYVNECMFKMGDGGHFVFSVSSHGTYVVDKSGDEPDGRDEAICLYDRLLIDDQFRKLLDHAPVGLNITVIADCCHSGSITRNALRSSKGPGFYRKPRYLPPKDENIATKGIFYPVKNKIFTTENDMNEVLITGCLDTEFSYDALFGKSYHGALTYNLCEILKSNDNITYYQLHEMLKSSLPSKFYPQTPQLEGRDENKKRIIFS
jgi:hypothetical protein